MKNYIRWILLLTFVLTGLVAAANWFINPYLMFNGPVINGINTLITENYYKQLVFKPYQLRHMQPRSIIFGASHAGIAFDPDLLPQPAYNLAIGGATSYINYRLLQESIVSSPALDTVILEVPFFAFNSDDPNNQPDRDKGFEHRLSLQDNGEHNTLLPFYELNDKLSSLISWEVSRASARTVSKQEKVSGKRKGSFIQRRNGQWIQQAPMNVDTLALFENSWKKFLYDEWFPAPAHTFTLSSDTQQGPLSYYRNSLRLLYEKNIHTTVVIAPLHGSLLIALREAGLWPTFTQWKKVLTRIDEEEAQRVGKKPFLIVDYAFINTYTTEALPGEENKTARLSNFNDSAHASPTFGEQILTEIQSGQLTIGSPLSSTNNEDHLSKIEKDLTEYADHHPELVCIIKNLIAQTPWNQVGKPL